MDWINVNRITPKPFVSVLCRMPGEKPFPINKLELTQPIDNSIKEMEDYFEQQKKRSSQPFME